MPTYKVPATHSPLNRSTMAAAAADRSESVRDDLRRFLRGATHETRLSQQELTHTALKLLRSLPAARQAGLEYLSTVLGECTAQFVTQLEEGDTPEGAAAAAGGEDDLVAEIGATLSSLLEAAPAGWVPLISAWALELLGRLSARYAARAHVPHSAGLNDSVQLWLCCPATRALVTVTVQCVRRDTDVCIKPLLETSATYTPHFDWVVAHIGSCFPGTIIERVLAVGLREFCAQKPTDAGELSGQLNSVVSILGHLADRNSSEICEALKALFQESVGPPESPGVPPSTSVSTGGASSSETRLATVPFLLHLASLSPMLLITLSTEIAKTVTAQQLAVVAEQLPSWIPRHFATTESLLSLAVHLVLGPSTRSMAREMQLGCERGAITLLQLLLRAADHGQSVGRAAEHLLERVLSELQRLVFDCQPGSAPDVPLLTALPDALPQLAAHLSADDQRARRCVQLLATAATARGPSAAAHTLSRLLERPELRLATPLRMLRALESNFPTVFVEAFRHASAESAAPERVLRSVVRLLRWERRQQAGAWLQTPLAGAVSECAPLLAERLTELGTADAAIEALALLELPDSLAGSRQLSLADSVVGYLFYCLRRGDRPAAMLRRTRLAQQLLARLAGQPVCLPAVLRALLHAALQPHLAPLLGASEGRPPPGPASRSLLEENRLHWRIVTVPQAHTTVFHAGVIGEGRRPDAAPPVLPPAAARLNCELVVETVSRCLAAARSPDDAARTLALLLVEFISPDVMFNGLPWPEEEFMKVTMERDLKMRRFFDDHPLSWCLLELVARRPPAICYCSVLLRALAATLIQHWSSTQESLASKCSSQLEVTERLLYVMALGRLLPPPLTLIPEMLASLTSHEVYLLLTDVWAYMRDTVPTPAAFTLDANGVTSRSFPPLESRFTTNLLLVLQNNVAKLGHLFPQVRAAIANDQARNGIPVGLERDMAIMRERERERERDREGREGM
ncbi:integrator complex subunit 5-like isoform X2 [Amphibalanus amphitrite]|uniref:integrator complex subunit 5-like isoform X2 n=1 Tax=Amphibalanus amphitrite TaxID=1232801 RepID=UPI001C925B4A|nr:integrator complex subunit 5-like isoform X2 [Amphibalanus amphitrite]